MPKLPQVSGKQVIKALKKIGFEVISQKGSHIKIRRESNGKADTVTVPNHRQIRKGTLRNGIIKPINLTGDGDFYILLEYFIKTKKSVIVVANARRTAREIKTLSGIQFNDLRVLRKTINFTKKIRR